MKPKVKPSDRNKDGRHVLPQFKDEARARLCLVVRWWRVSAHCSAPRRYSAPITSKRSETWTLEVFSLVHVLSDHVETGFMASAVQQGASDTFSLQDLGVLQAAIFI